MKYKPLFACRLNSFTKTKGKSRFHMQKVSVIDLLNYASAVRGLTHADLNFPQHFETVSIKKIKETLTKTNLKLNGIAIRFTDKIYLQGSFTNPQRRIRRKAIELVKRGIDTLIEMKSSLLTIWFGPDGFDYPFQVNYAQMFEYMTEGLFEIAKYNPNVNISIEYKPNDPRAFSIVPNASTALLLIKNVGRSNLGVTLDFCHSLDAKENPAASALLILNKSQLLGVHLNDGYGYNDDGLMVGSIHPIETLELLYILIKHSYKYPIYFDTFPVYLDPIEECSRNISRVKLFLDKAGRIDNKFLSRIWDKQETISSQKLIDKILFGR